MCGLTIDQFQHLTPNEFNVIFKAKVKNRREEWEFKDMLNAVLCEVVARCAGNKDAKLEDFRILKYEEESRVPDTPETLQDKLMMLTMSMGGQVITRG